MCAWERCSVDLAAGFQACQHNLSPHVGLLVEGCPSTLVEILRFHGLLELFNGENVVGPVRGILRARVKGEAYVRRSCVDVGASIEGESWS